MDDPSLHPSIARGHELAEADLRPVWLAGLGLVALIIGSLLLVAGMMRLFAVEAAVERTPANARLADETNAAEPSVEVDQVAELKQLVQQQREMLRQLQWIDRQAGIARIPIDDAMAIIANRGLSVRFGDSPPE
jgi:hypothetical protein